MSTIKINELATTGISLTDFLVKADANGYATKNTMQGLQDFLSTLGDTSFKGTISAGTYATKDAGWYFASNTGNYVMGSTTIAVDVSDTLTIIIVPSFINDSSKVEIPINITFDAVPTDGSTNAVTSEGVKDYVDSKEVEIVTSLDFVEGSMNENSWTFTSGASANLWTPIQELQGINNINIFSETYNSGQPNIFWLKLENDVYTLVTSNYITEATTYLNSDFPATATHYVVRGVKALNVGDVFYNRYKKTSLTLISENKALIDQNITDIATNTQAIIDKKELLETYLSFTRGTFNFTTGVFTASDSSGVYSTFSNLENIESINYFASTYNSGQHNIFWLKLENDGTFTTVSSDWNEFEVTILKADFPATATHYVVRGIFALNPETFFNINYKILQNVVSKNESDILTNENKNESQDLEIVKNTNFVTETKEQYLDNYIKVSILDPNDWSTNTSINDTTGVPFELINSAANVSGYSKIQLNTLYSIGFSDKVWMYGYNREYLGFIAPTSNKDFTITNPLCNEIRLASPSIGSICAIKKYTINTPSGVLRPSYIDESNKTLNDLYKYPLQGFGNSIIAFSLAGFFTDLTGRANSIFSYGGCESSCVRTKFFELKNDEGCITFLYMGHNNIDETRVILNDIERMVDSLGHYRYIIASTPTGTYSTEQGTIDFVNDNIELENRLEAIYGNHFINTRKGIVAGYGYNECRVTQDFTQPPADGTTTVDIYVDNVPFMMFRNALDDVSWIPDQDLFKLGIDDSENPVDYDEYEIINSTITSGDSGYLTCKLVPSAQYRIAVGQTVGNLQLQQTPAGSSTPIDYIKYLQVVKSADEFLLGLNTAPTTARVDAVHPNDYGAKFVAKMLARKANSMNF